MVKLSRDPKEVQDPANSMAIESLDEYESQKAALIRYPVGSAVLLGHCVKGQTYRNR